MKKQQNEELNSSNSGFYKASSDEGEDRLFMEQPKMNNFIPMISLPKHRNRYKMKQTEIAKRPPRRKEKKRKSEKFGQPVDLKTTDFSIQNDLFFGWKPNIGIKNPFPLFYNDKLMMNLENCRKFIYKGFRPVHSYRLHEFFCGGEGKYPYTSKSFRLYMNEDIKKLLKMKVEHDLPVVRGCSLGMGKVTFDSFFESGNCDMVFENFPMRFDVYLRVDSNTRGHTHWFYFRVKSEDMATVTIRIKNMSKSDSIFRKGGNPYISYDNLKWTQVQNSTYYPTEYDENSFDPRPPGYRKMHTLEFKLSLSPDSWTYVAYCPPYTFSELNQFLLNQHLEKKTEIVKRELFCKSESGIDSPMLTITEFEKLDCLTEREDRPIIILTSRVHPGETCSSHLMHGIIAFLLGGTKPARLLRELFEFMVIPMLNTDGVILGNFRAGLAGDDLNRQYLKPEAEFHPSVLTLLNKVANLRSDRRVAMFIDLHGHSTKPNVFSYGPELAKHDPLFDLVRVLPKMISEESEAFKFTKCTWKINKCKKATARAVFLNQQSNKFLLTIL